jgi:hypothetical protein
MFNRVSSNLLRRKQYGELSDSSEPAVSEAPQLAQHVVSQPHKLERAQVQHDHLLRLSDAACEQHGLIFVKRGKGRRMCSCGPG